ncbi:uncharacterized protein F5Z01DRAFT_646784 [Emericellopsis atlantica]|uniref:Uncharacterized protein n=1 Tax=Emericellopsis atlantica TaxID=2614577 RepID=A0A9P7ZTT9_9HYPO|nr:uncharacterized protein F5Z01DRAFT_646784 [Emericellopsis atlantica]KAG9257706.1 hypothetical protein F5Z01DRAFT_646784 [Emericellopsis atlantica]
MDDQLDEAAMAQMMGFSAFGGPDRPQKKRRYNPGADAQVYISKPESSTGSNMTPLGARKGEGGFKAASGHALGTKANDDEIKLDDEADEEPPTPTPLHQQQPIPYGLPQRPAFATSQGEPGAHGVIPQHGSRNTQGAWYRDYYDPRFNQNPWDKLERNLGLQAQGTWLPQSSHRPGEVST